MGQVQLMHQSFQNTMLIASHIVAPKCKLLNYGHMMLSHKPVTKGKTFCEALFEEPKILTRTVHSGEKELARQ